MASLFSKPKLPPIKDPTPMPDQEQLTKARRRLLAAETKGTGVQSTILSGQRETLGA